MHIPLRLRVAAIVVGAAFYNLAPLDWSALLVVGLCGAAAAKTAIPHNTRRSSPPAFEQRRDGPRQPRMGFAEGFQPTGIASYPLERLADDLRIIRGEHVR